MKLLFTLLLAIFFCKPAFAADELKICEEGINKCEPLIQDAQKYSRCMLLMCFNYYSPEAKKEKDKSKFFFKMVEMQEVNPTPKNNAETVNTCEYGLRKCEALNKNPQYYWECMADSCRNPSADKPDCKLGQNLCVDRQKSYNDCMRLTCGAADANPKSCPEGQRICGESLRTYWQCVYNICLGPVDKYIKPATVKRFMIVSDRNGIKRRIQVNSIPAKMESAPAWIRTAPPGVDPDEWVQNVPQKFLLIDNPANYMTCLMPTAVLDCRLNDIRSCSCSDGTTPLMLNGEPTPGWKD